MLDDAKLRLRTGSRLFARPECDYRGAAVSDVSAVVFHEARDSRHVDESTTREVA